MTVPAAIFVCSICGEPAGEICVFCTKDACVNHRCDRCKRCSDCCECDVPLSAAEAPALPGVEPAPEPAAVESSIEHSEPETTESEVEARLVEGEPQSESTPEPSEDFPPPQPQNPIF